MARTSSGTVLSGRAALLALVLTSIGAAAPPPPAPAPRSPQAEEFFESKVRPVLAENCYSCHGPKVQQAGLRLDSPNGMQKGTDAGKMIVVKGDPDHSPLIQVLRHDGKIRMPPTGKLPQEAIDALGTWVKMGAHWPSQDEEAGTSKERGKGPHWAFQPVRQPAIPAVRNKAWMKTPVDALVLARLEKKGLAPSPIADRRTLIRRATFDLTGLPPTAEEVTAFVQDRLPDAWEKVVDRLLASPRYGERWARYWLDVARYADTKGYVFQEERRYPNAYTYRDYVVRAFNEDVPYDQFLIQQIAADQLELGPDKSVLAAMGFLTLGRRFLNQQADIIDDRIDVLMRGTQALTVGCARCHDHKFDPIPTADYYSLYGVFASSSEPRDLPIIATPERTEAYLAYEKKRQELQADVDRFLDQKLSDVLKRGKERIAAGMLAARDLSGGADANALSQRRGVSRGMVTRWQTFLLDTAKNHHPIFAPWHALAALKDEEFAAKAPALAAAFAANANPARMLHPKVAEFFAGAPPASLAEVAERYEKLLAEPPFSDQQLRNALNSIGGPLNLKREDVENLLERDERNQARALRAKVDAHTAASEARPPQAMVLVDSSFVVNPRIFRRGNPNNRGDEVPRQFLAVLSGPERKPFQKGSGRLELAQAIANKQNPLTARVMVNRVWLNHFGSPLVTTPSDFGVRSDPPANPELLDYLASRFMEDGWSLKKLHRLLLLSSVYQQRSDDNPQSALKDPENRLFWRMNRRRLDFEAMRDSLLFVSGRLDQTIGGPAVEITRPPYPLRRTIYGFIDRQNLPGLFRVFDFASPDTTSPQRFVTTVPQQALFMMNSPFLVEQAKSLVARRELTAEADPARRVQALYGVVLARAATPAETELGLRFVSPAGSAAVQPTSTEGPKAAALNRWERYAQALLMSNEFLFAD